MKQISMVPTTTSSLFLRSPCISAKIRPYLCSFPLPLLFPGLPGQFPFPLGLAFSPSWPIIRTALASVLNFGQSFFRCPTSLKLKHWLYVTFRQHSPKCFFLHVGHVLGSLITFLAWSHLVLLLPT